MKDGDLTEEEASKEEINILKEEEDKKVAEGKIAFKKPTKREKDEHEKKDSEEPKKKKEKNEKKIKKKSLLSFDEDGEDEL